MDDSEGEEIRISLIAAGLEPRQGKHLLADKHTFWTNGDGHSWPTALFTTVINH